MTATMKAGATIAARNTVRIETVSGPYGNEIDESVREKTRFEGGMMEKTPPMMANALDGSC